MDQIHEPQAVNSNVPCQWISSLFPNQRHKPSNVVEWPQVVSRKNDARARLNRAFYFLSTTVDAEQEGRKQRKLERDSLGLFTCAGEVDDERQSF